MVLILDGSSEVGGHVRPISVIWFNEGNWLEKEQSKIGFFFSPKRSIFIHGSATCSELTSIIFTMD